MPFYEYQCNHCNHRLEVLQKISDAPLEHCPECNQPTLKKLISAAAFRLKGSGWYETDFKHNDKKKAESKGDGDKGTDKPNAGGSDSKADSSQSSGTKSSDAGASPAAA